MTKKTRPVLCGGTIFALVLEARKPRIGKKDQLFGNRDILSEPSVLSGLVKVMYPDFTNPQSEDTFKTNVSDYKTCKNNGGNLPFFDREIKAFDNRVKTEYQTALLQMCGFVNEYIEVGGSVKRDEWLIKALLDLVDADQSIANTDKFYVSESGMAVAKTDLQSLSVICLPAFLLGIWHFAVVSRPDNTVGKDTFDEWCPSHNRNKRVYIGHMGERIVRQITVTMYATSDTEDNEEPVSSEGEPFVDFTSAFAETELGNDSEKTTNQTIITPAVFINNGANAMQIYNAGTLNIDRGGKHEK